MDTTLIIIIIAQVLGLISWLLLLYSYTREDIDDLLYLQIFVAFFDVASYLLLGADAGMLICLIELIKTFLYYKTDKDRLIFWIGLIGYILIGLLTIDHWYAILPVLGSVIDSYGASRNSKICNIASIISNILWIIYDLIILSYIGAVTDFTIIVCNVSVLLFGYSKLLRISKMRIIKNNYLTKKLIDKIYDLDLKNYGKDNLWDKKYQMDVFNKNKDSLFVIKYKNDFIGYINYLNIEQNEYESLKRKRTMPNKFNLDSIIKYKKNKKSYIVIESINVLNQYERDGTISLIEKKLKSFIKSKLEDHTEDYKKELKELDKQMDRIKAVYIKGILKVEDFEQEIKQIEYRKKELNNNIKNQKQYDDMNFTTDDLMFFEDKQQVDYYTNPSTYLSLITNWIMLNKKDKHKLISHYIDNIELERHGDKIKIISINMLKSYLSAQLKNHKEYGTPNSLELFETEDGVVALNTELRTSAIKYYSKLKEYMKQFTDCEFNYIEDYIDLNNEEYSIMIKETERVLRIIALKGDKKIDKVKLGFITIDLNNVKDLYSKEYKDFINEFSNEYKDLVRKEFNRKFSLV